MKSESGFTLLEMMVVVAIIAITASFAAPRFTEALQKNQLRSEASDFYTLLRYARAEAIKAGKPTVVGAFDENQEKGGKDLGEWKHGIVVWEEGDGAAETFDVATDGADDRELRRSEFDAEMKFTMTPDVKFIAFDASGFADQKLEIDVCPQQGKIGRQIVVLQSGLTTILDKTDC